MQINLVPKIELAGRHGLSRSLTTRFSETVFLNVFIALALCTGFFALMNVFLPLMKLQFKSVLSFSAFFQLVFFLTTTYIAWVLFETYKLRVHLHSERIIYEIKDKGAVAFDFTEIQNIHFKHQHGVFGFYLVLKNGTSYHFPIHLERLDYILDSLHFHRPDLTQTEEFFKFRRIVLAVDHALAHNRSYIARANFKAISFYFLYPFYLKKDLIRLKENPNEVRRNLDLEKRLETLCHKVNIGISLTTLAIVVLLNYHI